MRRNRPPRGRIPEDQLSSVYILVEKAIQETKPDGKTTDQIFGEIYTKFRTSVGYFNAGTFESLKPLFRGQLKLLNGTAVGNELNEIICELYAEHVANEESIMDLELCAIIMDDCLLDAKDVTRESAKVLTTLDQISDDLNGENNV